MAKWMAKLVKSKSWHQALHYYLLAHIHAFKMSARNLILMPLTTFVTLAVIGFSLSLPISLYVFVKNVQQLSERWHAGAFMTLYLHPGETTQQVDRLLAQIKKYPIVQKTTYLTAEEALQEFQEASGLAETLSLLPDNPLPGVIHIELRAQDTSQQELTEMNVALTKDPLVSLATFDYEWVEKLNAFLSFGALLSNILYLLIGIGITLMVGNTIRLSLERHRDEIIVLHLVGATLPFILRPFLYRGILLGICGSLIALFINYLVIYLLTPSVDQLASLYEGIFSLHHLSLSDSMLFLIASSGLGWLGALLAFTQQHRAMMTDNV